MFSALPDLNKGVTFAILNVLGKVPSLREVLKIKNKTYLISS